MAVIIPQRSEIFTPDGMPTLRFYEFLRSLTDQGNSTSEGITAVSENTALALLFDLRQDVGSGDFLTSDETGFSVDSTKLTVDQTEA